ncbi:hypothetical protein CFOL_v3_17527, partial [Cephalotus follicularis]
LLVSGSTSKAQQTWQDPDCADVAWDFLPCFSFLQGELLIPTYDCCIQLKDLNKIAKQKDGTRRICKCIERMVGEEGEMLSSRVEALSGICHVERSFAISNRMAC